MCNGKAGTRWGKCAICKELRILQSVIGSHKGNVWAGWICRECYIKARNKE